MEDDDDIIMYTPFCTSLSLSGILISWTIMLIGGTKNILVCIIDFLKNY